MFKSEGQAADTEKEGRQGSEQGGRAKRMREQARQFGSAETVAGLEQIFEAKLAAVRSYEQRLSAVTDPYARRVVQQMICQERKELLHLAELTDLVEQSPEMNCLTRTRRRMDYQVKASTGRDMKFWLGAAAVGAVLLPGVREQLRPLAVKAVQGVMGLTEQAQALVSGMREDMEDLVSEARFERFSNAYEREEAALEDVDTDPL